MLSNLEIIGLKNSSDSQIGLGLRPRPILAVLGFFFIQLFPNWTACSPITYTNKPIPNTGKRPIFKEIRVQENRSHFPC